MVPKIEQRLEGFSFRLLASGRSLFFFAAWLMTGLCPAQSNPFALKQHWALTSLPYNAWRYLDTERQQDKQWFFYHGESNQTEVKAYAINRRTLLLSDSLSFRLAEDNAEVNAVSLSPKHVFVLAFDRLLVFDLKGEWFQTYRLPASFTQLTVRSGRLFLANTYDFGADPALMILATDLAEIGGAGLSWDTIYHKKVWPGQPMSMFMHRWVAIGPEQLFIADPIQQSIEVLDHQGRSQGRLLLPPEIKSGAIDTATINEMYRRYPRSARKQMFLEMQDYLTGRCYLEKVFCSQESLWVTVKPAQALDGRRFLFHCSLEALGEENPAWSLDTLVFSPFPLNQSRYRYADFPLHLELNRAVQFEERRVFSALEMSFYPLQSMSAQQYETGMLNYLQKGSIHHSILLYEIRNP